MDFLTVALGGRKINYNTGNHNALAEFYLNYKKNLKSISSTM